MDSRDEEVRRLVRGYAKVDESLVEEYDLPTSVPLGLLQSLWAVGQDDRMYDCYPIAEREADALAQFLPERLRPDRCDYFLEAESTGRET